MRSISTVLERTNIAVRKRRPFFSCEHSCDVFTDGNFLEICFLSKRCSRDLHGSCLMCDYGEIECSYPISTYLEDMDRALDSLDDAVDTLLLSTNGSLLDTRQIPPELLNAILGRVALTETPVVEIETHYLDISIENLTIIKRVLSHKRVVMEIGLETTNQWYQDNVIMKGINLTAFKQKIELIRSFGYYIDTNIMVGLPFMSPREQFDDALRTIRWSFSHGCRPVLFPMNIKPFTLLMLAYRAGFYKPISGWLVPLILKELSEEELSQVAVTWYGNREDIYDLADERAVFPKTCSLCDTPIRTFYEDFARTADGKKRRTNLHKLMTETECSCLKQVTSEIIQSPSAMDTDEYTAFLFWLKNLEPFE